MADPQKDALVEFYAAETKDRDTPAWLEEGGSACVPERAAGRYFLGRKVAAATALAGLPASARVLEVGCSFGHQTFLFAPRFAHVTAVDLSPESIDLARRRAERWGVRNVRFEVADAERLDGLADASFDAVFCFSTVRFCADPVAALRAFVRVARPGAPVVVDFPNAKCPWFGPIKRSLGIHAHIHDRLYLADEVEALMRQVGLTRVAVRRLLFTSKRVPGPLLPLFRLADAVGERTPGVRELAAILMARGVKVGAG